MLRLSFLTILFFVSSFCCLSQTALASKATYKIRYFTLDCSIFSEDGKLIYKPLTSAIFCAFNNNGHILMSNPMAGYLMMVDENDKPIWRSQEVAHHKISFTPDQKNFLVMSSEVILHKGERVRSDCFSVRELDNTKKYEWCASRHLKELTQLGFNMDQLWEIEGDNNNFYYNENVKREITHANSFYQIQANNSQIPAFKAGNYIVHLYGEARPLLILDSKLEKILWHMDVSHFKIDHQIREIDSHALQVTEKGTILAYFSEIIDKDTIASLYFNSQLTVNMPIINDNEFKTNLIRQSLHSRLVEFDPANKNIIWQYKQNPLGKFYSPVFGWVHQLPDDTFFFNENSKLHRIDRNGKEIWSFTNPVINNNTQKPMKIIDTTIFSDTGFFESRGIAVD